MKENYRIQVADYAVDQNIDDQPAFAWLVPYTQQKCWAILSAVKARVQATTVKYEIKRPQTLQQALEYDQENNNTLWKDAIDLEMNTILPAFDLPKNNKAPPGYAKSSGHIVFNINMDFTQKTRWVKNGHLTKDSVDSNYAFIYL